MYCSHICKYILTLTHKLTYTLSMTIKLACTHTNTHTHTHTHIHTHTHSHTHTHTHTLTYAHTLIYSHIYVILSPRSLGICQWRERTPIRLCRPGILSLCLSWERCAGLLLLCIQLLLPLLADRQPGLCGQESRQWLRGGPLVAAGGWKQHVAQRLSASTHQHQPHCSFCVYAGTGSES